MNDWNSTFSACTDRLNTWLCCERMNSCTGPFGSAMRAFTSAGLMFVPKVSLMNLTVSFT